MDTELSDLQVVPSDARPVTSFGDRDKAWVEVVAAFSQAARRVQLHHDGALTLRTLDLDHPIDVRMPQMPSTSIGRSAAARLRLPFPGISRQHCVVHADGGTLSVRDLDSKNGTFLDGTRVESAVLASGSVLSLGTFRLAVGTLASGPPSVVPDSPTATA
jgi:hypothetical protein